MNRRMGWGVDDRGKREEENHAESLVLPSSFQLGLFLLQHWVGEFERERSEAKRRKDM